VVGSLIYSLLRALLDALATSRRDQAELQAEVLALRRQVQVLERPITRVHWNAKCRSPSAEACAALDPTADRLYIAGVSEPGDKCLYGFASKSVPSPDRFGESEVLIEGTVRGATPLGAPWEALASP